MSGPTSPGDFDQADVARYIGGPGLTRARRKETCIHEAAHAVIHALGGGYTYQLAVAPEGSTVAWTYTGRKGPVLTGVWGVCETSDAPFIGLRWDEIEGGYALDRALYAALIRGLSGQRGWVPEHRRQLRAHVCGLLAGPLADSISACDLEPYADQEDGEGQDVTVAGALCWALPSGRAQFDHAERVTLAALREPEIWQEVVALADALEVAGSMESDAIEPFLPERRKHWPPSARRGAAA